MDVYISGIIALSLGYWIFKTVKRWKKSPPGPWGLPIVGYLPFLDRHEPQKSLAELSKRYGPIYSLKMGSVNTVVISDHELLREAFSKDVFSGRAPLYVTHGVMNGCGVICTQGELWKDQRKLVLMFLRNLGVKNNDARDKLTKRISSGIYELIEKIKECNGTPVDLSDMFKNSFGNVVNDIVYGFKYPFNDKTWNWIRTMQNEFLEEMAVAGPLNFLPFLRFILKSAQTTMEFLIKSKGEALKIIYGIVARRRKLLGLETPTQAKYKDICNEDSNGIIKYVPYRKNKSVSKVQIFDPKVLIPSVDESILDKFLKEQKKRYEDGSKNAYFVRDEQLYHFMCDMFGASLDTTVASLSWFLLFMALHTEEQDKVRKQILEMYPEDCDIDHTKLPYLMAAISETQRIRTVAPLGVPHGCLEDTYLGKYKITKGTMIIPLLWAIHMDPNVWQDPDKFNPSRFINDNGELLKSSAFIPFQIGKRMCPGDELSRIILANVTTRLLRSYKIRLHGKHPTPQEMKGHVRITFEAPEVHYICEPIL